MKSYQLILLATVVVIQCAWQSAWAARPKDDARVMGITPEMIVFNYESTEGDIFMPCTHTLVNAPAQDWEVVCKNGSLPIKKYMVHLWVTHYTHPTPPLTSYEVLYWVTDTATAQHPATGTTFFFNLNESASMHSLQIRQSVENDNASLRLELRIP